jgi:hypothetical protein
MTLCFAGRVNILARVLALQPIAAVRPGPGWRTRPLPRRGRPLGCGRSIYGTDLGDTGRGRGELLRSTRCGGNAEKANHLLRRHRAAGAPNEAAQLGFAEVVLLADPFPCARACGATREGCIHRRMARMQVYLPEAMYEQVKARGLRVSELLQKAVQAELRRQDLLAETDRYLGHLIAEVGSPSAAQSARAAAVARRLSRRALRKAG